MSSMRTQSKTIVQALAVVLLFVSMAAAQIPKIPAPFMSSTNFS